MEVEGESHASISNNLHATHSNNTPARQQNAVGTHGTALVGCVAQW